jgi:hypothetical protein
MEINQFCGKRRFFWPDGAALGQKDSRFGLTARRRGKMAVISA